MKNQSASPTTHTNHNDTNCQLDLFLHGKPASQQEAHVRALHGKSANLAFIHIKKADRFRTVSILPGHDLPAWIKEYSHYIQSDAFLSQSRFNSDRRRIANVAELGACFADIDFFNTERYGNVWPAGVYDDIRQTLEEHKIPEPTFCVFTGRGLCLLWILQLGTDNLGLWNNIQAWICQALSEYGADKAATDAARILRIIGTINTKSGKRVRVLEGNNAIYTLEDFGKPPQHEVNTNPALQTWQGKILWGNRLKDFMKLPALLGTSTGERIPEGRRHNWLLLCYVALAWLDAARYWQREKGGLLCHTDGYDQASLDASLACLDTRKNEKQGPHKGLYKFSNQVIRDWLGLDVEFCLEHGLYSLAGKAWLHGQALTDYKTHKRREVGIKDRSTYLEETTNWHIRSEIRKLRSQGLSERQIGHKLGISRARAWQLLQPARGPV